MAPWSKTLALSSIHTVKFHTPLPPPPSALKTILGALDLTSKVAYLGMTPLSKVVALSTDDKLDRLTLKMVLDSGHSRLPVYDGHK